MSKLSLGLFLSTAWLFAAVPSVAEPVDALRSQDRVRVKVLEWLPANGEYREWPAVGGEYTVSADRTVTLPFAGTVAVSSRSLGAVAGDIADGLQRGLSLPMRPDVNIEVIGRAPVYVLGGVETPGKVEFTPGLTALQAVTLAGGFYRGGGGAMRLERDTINAEGDLDAARDAFARLQARIARLSAEMASQNDMKAEAAKAAGTTLEPLLIDEQALFEVRRQARKSRLESLSSRRQLATEQLKALDEQAATLDRQLGLTREQLAKIQTLADKGLTLATRVFDLERTLSDLEGRRLDVQVGRLSTTLAINEAERDQVDLLTDFQTMVANDLQSARSELTQKGLEIDRAQALLRESTIIAPEKLIDRTGNISIDVRIFLTRSSGSRASTIEISKNDPVEAGDTLQVQMKPDDAPLSEQTNAVH